MAAEAQSEHAAADLLAATQLHASQVVGNVLALHNWASCLHKHKHERCLDDLLRCNLAHCGTSAASDCHNHFRTAALPAYRHCTGPGVKEIRVL